MTKVKLGRTVAAATSRDPLRLSRRRGSQDKKDATVAEEFGLPSDILFTKPSYYHAFEKYLAKYICGSKH